MHSIALRAEAIGFRPSLPSCSSSFLRGVRQRPSSLLFYSCSATTPTSPAARHDRRRFHASSRHLTRQESSIGEPVPHLPIPQEAHPRVSENNDTTTREPATPTEILHLFRARNPETLLEGIIQHSNRDELVASLPRNAFLELLRLLDPAYFVNPYKTADRFLAKDLSQRTQIPHKKSKPSQKRSLKLVFGRFMDQVNAIVFARRRGGHSLGIVEYTYLLNCARLMGDYHLANVIWSSMERDGVNPDATCYNHFIEAICWSQAYEYEDRERFRLIPYNYSRRLPPLDRRIGGFKGYRTGPRGIKPMVTNIFREMVERGEPEDERTFTLLMTAMAREGDIEGVKGILHNAWNVNVDAIVNLEEGASEEEDFSMIPKQYPPGSPLRPSTRLLFVIAHVFCINNQVATAMRLIDFVSRHYSVSITPELWEYLLEWTYVLSVRRFKMRKTDGASLGRLSQQVLWELWQTMLGEPYNVVPTMPMYWYVIKNLAGRCMYIQMQDLMHQALPLYDHSHREYKQALEEYNAESDMMDGAVSPTTRRKAELAAMRNSRDTRFFRRWVGLLLANKRWPYREGREWQLRGFQTVIETWSRFLPPIVYVECSDFKIQISRLQIMLVVGKVEDQVPEPDPPYMEPTSTIYTIGESLRASPDEEFL
jgi:hypothetical protein